MWRAGTDSLPSKMNLLKRKVLSNDLCPDCKLESESSFHALWTCRVVAPVWKCKFEWLRKLAVRCNSFLDVIELCQDHNGLLDLFAMIGSLLWSRRNQLRLGEKVIQLQLINSMASENLWEFQNAAASTCPVAKVAVPTRWLPPPKDWVKVNFDGAIFQKEKLAGLGCIIRNDEGLVMAAFTQCIPLPTSVEMVEVLAARSAIGFARELCLSQVILEGDSDTIIRALFGGGFDSSSFGHIIRDIKLLSSVFQNLSFCHTRRQGNSVAHRLARLACKFSHFQIWMEDLPPDIVSVYLSELP
nr:putative ribonuclease h protein [Quercus suber]